MVIQPLQNFAGGGKAIDQLRPFVQGIAQRLKQRLRRHHPAQAQRCQR